MQKEYKPFSKIAGADFVTVNTNFYDLYDLLEDFKAKLEELEEETEELEKQLQEIDINPANFRKRVKTKVQLLKKRTELQYFNNIFINKFLKKENEIIEKEKKNIEKEEIEELLKLQTKVIHKFKKLFLFFKQKEEEDKRLEEYLQNNF